MSELNLAPDERPSLRIAELSIENFRTFRERTVIPFSGGAGEPDAIATFHGDNGSGKSNALAALQFFFRALWMMLQQRPGGVVRWPWEGAASTPMGACTVRRRDRPSDAQGPTAISARFADERVGTLTVRLTPAGSALDVELDGLATEAIFDAYRPWLGTPSGRPMAILDAGRRVSWVVDEDGDTRRRRPHGEVIEPALVEDLFAAHVSRDPRERARWRDFEAELRAVPAFAGKDITINRPKKGGDPELTFEEHDKSVLGLEDLSSGERQLVVLFAGVLLARAAIVAIEEPELSLDAKSQLLFHDFLARLVQKRRIDQAIIESHVAAFDGPNVIRFQRVPGGATSVTRACSESVEQAAITQKAKEANAQRQWVTRDGYTELPEVMRKDLGLTQGGGLWFLKRDRWEAWPDQDVAQMLGGGEPGEGERE